MKNRIMVKVVLIIWIIISTEGILKYTNKNKSNNKATAHSCIIFHIATPNKNSLFVLGDKNTLLGVSHCVLDHLILIVYTEMVSVDQYQQNFSVIKWLTCRCWMQFMTCVFAYPCTVCVSVWVCIYIYIKFNQLSSHETYIPSKQKRQKNRRVVSREKVFHTVHQWFTTKTVNTIRLIAYRIQQCMYVCHNLMRNLHLAKP